MWTAKLTPQLIHLVEPVLLQFCPRMVTIAKRNGIGTRLIFFNPTASKYTESQPLATRKQKHVGENGDNWRHHCNDITRKLLKQNVTEVRIDVCRMVSSQWVKPIYVQRQRNVNVWRSALGRSGQVTHAGETADARYSQKRLGNARRILCTNFLIFSVVE